MAAFRDRFPSARDTARVFATCAVPIYSWSILVYLSQVRGWVYHIPAWDVAGILFYVLVFAALESGAILLVLLLLGAILPGWILRDRFVVHGSALAILALGCAVVDHVVIARPSFSFAQQHPKWYNLGVVAFLLALVVSCVLAYRHDRLAKVLSSAVERLVPLMSVYMLATFIAVVILVIRNL